MITKFLLFRRFEAENVARFEKPDIKGYIAADDHKIIVSFASTTFNLTQLAMNLSKSI